MAFHVGKSSILSTLDPDFIEDGRADIYKWSETRRSKRKGISGKLYQFKKLFIDKTVSRDFYLFKSCKNLCAWTSCQFWTFNWIFILQIIRTFIHNLTVIVLLQMILAGEDKFLRQSCFVCGIVLEAYIDISCELPYIRT